MPRIKIAEAKKQGQGEVIIAGWVRNLCAHIVARPFYRMCHENDTSSNKSFYLIYSGLEITTGATQVSN